MHPVNLTVSGGKPPMSLQQEWWVLVQLLEKAVDSAQELQQLG